jgi:putative resolvase
MCAVELVTVSFGGLVRSLWGYKRLDKSAQSRYICSMNRKLWMHLQEAAVSLGISLKTLRRWDKTGKLRVARTAGNQRRISMAEIQHLQRQGEQAVRYALYARVTTGLQAQEGNLARQLERLRVSAAEREYQVVQTIAAYAWSLNEKRRGMKKRLSLVEQQAVDVVLIEDPDRLVRFGFSFWQETFRWQQVDPINDLLAAMLTIVTVFSRKGYAYRAHANPRPKKALPMLVSKSVQEERAV